MKLLLAIVLLSGLMHATSEQYEQGKKIYEKTCISCHGVKGDADALVSFIVNPRNLNKTLLSKEQIYQIIKKGAHFYGAAADIMPSFESVYNEQELRSVTHYVVTAFDSKAQERVETLYAKSDKITDAQRVKMLKRGAKIYKRNCSWCHGANGNGNGEATIKPEMSIFPYNLRKTLLDKQQLFLYIKYGGKYWGTAKEDMPSWERKYDDFTIKSVVKYIQTIQKGKNDAKK